MKSNGYNGHKNRAHWNVSLWIGNDESLYNIARHMIVSRGNRRLAARDIFQSFCDMQCTSKPTTPDGYRYNVTNIRAAIVGM